MPLHLVCDRLQEHDHGLSACKPNEPGRRPLVRDTAHSRLRTQDRFVFHARRCRPIRDISQSGQMAPSTDRHRGPQESLLPERQGRGPGENTANGGSPIAGNRNSPIRASDASPHRSRDRTSGFRDVSVIQTTHGGSTRLTSPASRPRERLARSRHVARYGLPGRESFPERGFREFRPAPRSWLLSPPGVGAVGPGPRRKPARRSPRPPGLPADRQAAAPRAVPEKSSRC
jgi:hypothetical protein